MEFVIKVSNERVGRVGKGGRHLSRVNYVTELSANADWTACCIADFTG
jgi:hypothetical protein